MWVVGEFCGYGGSVWVMGEWTVGDMKFQKIFVLCINGHIRWVVGGFCGYGGSVWVMGKWAVGQWIVDRGCHQLYMVCMV